jgi:hypothetical protein
VTVGWTESTVGLTDSPAAVATLTETVGSYDLFNEKEPTFSLPIARVWETDSEAVIGKTGERAEVSREGFAV